jgi:DNA-binding transcriptional MerR regulator
VTRNVPAESLSEQDSARLLRIQEAAAETGLTARAIRYYEEIGLLAPAARSEGAYRLYDAGDLERLRFIRALRDDAGFSLADIRQLLEDEEARVRLRARFTATTDPRERHDILVAALAQVERQIGTLGDKIARLQAMVDDAQARRELLRGHLRDVQAGGSPTHDASGDRRP